MAKEPIAKKPMAKKPTFISTIQEIKYTHYVIIQENHKYSLSKKAKAVHAKQPINLRSEYYFPLHYFRWYYCSLLIATFLIASLVAERRQTVLSDPK